MARITTGDIKIDDFLKMTDAQAKAWMGGQIAKHGGQQQVAVECGCNPHTLNLCCPTHRPDGPHGY